MALNTNQEKAANARGHLAVVAIAGSGKTHMLVERCMRLLLADMSHSVAMVTFTRASSDEMSERLMTAGADDRVQTNTFHSLAGEQVRSQGRTNRLLSGGEQYHMIMRARAATGAKISNDAATEIIGHYNNMLTPSDDGNGGWDLYQRYQQLLKQYQVQDFSDLSRNAVMGMRKNRISPLNVTHLLVDEYQDSDEIQFAWIMEHVKVGIEVTVVGDDDQSIYGWRGGLGFNGFVDFQKKTGAKALALDICYRCRPEILEVADRVIRNNVARIPKTLIASKSRGGDVQFRYFGDKHIEADAIADEVGKNPGQWAVLARTNRVLDDVEAALQSAQIPINRLGGKSIWENPAIVLYMGALVSLHGGPSRGLENLIAWAEEREVTLQKLHNSLKGMEFDYIRGSLAKDYCLNTRQLQESWSDWRKELRIGKIAPVLSGLVQWMAHAQPKRKGDVKMAEVAMGVLSRMDESLTLKQRIDKIRRGIMIQRSKDERGAVTIATLHSSKGLQFPRVWIPGLKEGTLPSDSNEDIEEERRLFYVGITRAEDQLITSTSDVASRFLAEAFPERFKKEKEITLKAS